MIAVARHCHFGRIVAVRHAVDEQQAFISAKVHMLEEQGLARQPFRHHIGAAQPVVLLFCAPFTLGRHRRVQIIIRRRRIQRIKGCIAFQRQHIFRLEQVRIQPFEQGAYLADGFINLSCMHHGTSLQQSRSLHDRRVMVIRKSHSVCGRIYGKAVGATAPCGRAFNIGENNHLFSVTDLRRTFSPEESNPSACCDSAKKTRGGRSCRGTGRFPGTTVIITDRLLTSSLIRLSVFFCATRQPSPPRWPPPQRLPAEPYCCRRFQRRRCYRRE